ncbi:MAG TPA: NAD(P)H-hydrate dehydratase [Verrucomicrobiae bacterium]
MPLPVISVTRMRAWEKATWAAGQTEQEVIRQVGHAVARVALRLTRPGDLILILAGRGNNGEDARAALNHLPARQVEMLGISDPARDLQDLEAMLSRHPALVIDGLFGIGLNRPLGQEWISFINRINSAGVKVLAVDVPSGLDPETGAAAGAAVQAAVTLAVGAPKFGMLAPSAWPYVGRLEVASDVGLLHCPETSDLEWTEPGDFAGFPPPRAAATHKGTYGHLAVLAGSLGFHGAAVLAARAAQRAQPGLITLHALPSVYLVVASQLQAVMVRPWEDQADLPGSFDAVLVGPGLAAPEMPEALKVRTRDLWQHAPVPVIADASALDWLPSGPVPEKALRVITPHPGEAARLLAISTPEVQADRPAALRNLSRKMGNTWVVLKGHQTLVGRSTGKIFINPSGNPHLAQGGSGDVLSGFIAGLLSQPELQPDPLTALRYAVWQHGASADHLQDNRSNWIVENLLEILGSTAPMDITS